MAINPSNSAIDLNLDLGKFFEEMWPTKNRDLEKFRFQVSENGLRNGPGTDCSVWAVTPSTSKFPQRASNGFKNKQK